MTAWKPLRSSTQVHWGVVALAIGCSDQQAPAHHVFEPAFVGSVKVSDHMMGFDLVGSTLVVLVERAAGPDDSDGIPDHMIDWYDVGEFLSR